MYRLFCSLLALIYLSGCCCSSRGAPLSDSNRPTPQQLEDINYPALVDVIFGYGVQLKNEHRLRLKNSHALFDVKINKIHLEFSSQDLVDLQGARATLVDVVEGLLERVNFNMAVSSSLSHRPFTPNDLEITIYYESFHGYFVDPNYTGRVDLRHGQVHYSSFAIYNSDYDPWKCKQESYTLSRQVVTIEREAECPYSPGYESNAPHSRFRERYYGAPVARHPPLSLINRL
jgi:hypothetical protein